MKPAAVWRRVVACGGLLLVATRAAADPCPASVLALYSTMPVESFAPADSTVQAGGRLVAYDLRRGTLRLVHTGGVGSAFVRGVDRYTVSGLPNGTRVDFAALLDVDGFSATQGCGGTGCYLTFAARLGDAGGEIERSVEATFAPDTVRLVETLRWPLVVEAGVPFELHFELSALRAPGASHWGGGTAALHFGGLPPGATVTSCQGYDSATPTRTTSWGRIKQIYR